MYSIRLVFNKHNITRVASCWFIRYYILVMHGHSDVKILLIIGSFLISDWQQSVRVFHTSEEHAGLNTQYGINIYQVMQH